ncbi:MAG: hypothetical protein ACLR8P_18195 [Clostridium fessum]
MKNVKAYVRTTLTAGLILAAAVLGGCSKSDAVSSAADTAAASSGAESAASADASNSNKKELKYGKAAGPYTVLLRMPSNQFWKKRAIHSPRLISLTFSRMTLL